MNFKRRNVLFNLYSFTETDTWQDFDQYKIPNLRLENVEVRNFLNDYESLIHVENDNYVVRFTEDQQFDDVLAIQYGNFESLAKIEINNCYIYDGNFANGMIHIPPKNILNESNWNLTLVRQNNNQKGFESTYV